MNRLPRPARLLTLLLLCSSLLAGVAPPDGRVVLRIADGAVADGVTLSVVGDGPDVVLVNLSGGVVIVHGAEGENYARLDARGVWIDPTSPTWLAQGRDDLTAPAGADSFALLDEGSDHRWHDPRSDVPDDDVDLARGTDEQTTLASWPITVDVDGVTVVIGAETLWLPTAVERAGEVPGSSIPTEWLVAGLAAALLGLLLLLRRRRA